jgi:hypothetical protein
MVIFIGSVLRILAVIVMVLMMMLMFRFGSDVLDKSRNVTQKCVIVKISLQLEDGSDYAKR